MNDRAMTKIVTTVLLTAASVVQTESVLAASPHATTSKALVFKGLLEDMRWGPVGATITVKNKKITKVKITVSPENPRSQFIDDQAVPLLKQQALDSQSAAIDGVSGATDTSDAFDASLQSAIKKAKHAKALK